MFSAHGSRRAGSRHSTRAVDSFYHALLAFAHLLSLLLQSLQKQVKLFAANAFGLVGVRTIEPAPGQALFELAVAQQQLGNELENLFVVALREQVAQHLENGSALLAFGTLRLALAVV